MGIVWNIFGFSQTVLNGYSAPQTVVDANSIRMLPGFHANSNDGTYNSSTQFIANENYSIDLTPGNYTMYANHYENGKLNFFEQEEITVGDDNSKFDLVLVPVDFQKSYDLNIGEIEPVNNYSKTNSADIKIVIIAVIVMLTIVFCLAYLKKKKLTNLTIIELQVHIKAEIINPDKGISIQ